MTIFFITILFLCSLSSCTSDVSEEPNPVVPASKVCCMQAYIGKIHHNDSTKRTRGWGGLDPNAEFLPTTYPLDYMYLMVQNGRKWKSLPIPIQGDADRKYIDICYNADENGNVYAMSDGQTLQVGPEMKCFFSSVPQVPKSLVTSTIKTPKGTSTYEPCGDEVFRSENLYFSYEEDDYGDMKIQSIWEKDKLHGEYAQPVEYNLNTLPIFRGTFVIVPRLIICDGYPDPEEETAKGGTYKLDSTTFQKKLGSFDDWNIRFFLAGKKGEKDFPAEIRIDYLTSSWNGYIIGKTSSARKHGIVALTENSLPLKDMEQQLTNVGGKKFNYIGFGVHDASFPFIYRGDTYLNSMELCCTIYHKKTDKAVTIRFPMNDLSINDVHILNYVIDADDIAAQLGLESATPTENSRAIVREYDEAFGEVANIPAIVIRN